MRRHRRIVASALAALLTLFLAPPAFAASGVFGGATGAREAIVLTTDAKAKKLRSAVISWEADCADDRTFPMAVELTPVASEAGFTPSYDDLVVTKNAKGRFAGKEFAVLGSATQTILVSVNLSGKLRSRRAAGKLKATVSILDRSTAAEVTTCETGTIKWSASRGAGRIFAGKTAQDEPVVVRLDRNGRRVTDLLVGWQSSTCQPPDSYLRFGEAFAGFGVKSRRFGDAWENSFATDDGGRLVYAYDLAGTVSRRSISGTLRVTVTGTDAAGATGLSCDTGAVTWRASTG